MGGAGADEGRRSPLEEEPQSLGARELLLLPDKQEFPLGKFEIRTILGHGLHGCLSKALYPALCTADLVYPGLGLLSLAWAPPLLQTPLGSILLPPAFQRLCSWVCACGGLLDLALIGLTFC